MVKKKKRWNKYYSMKIVLATPHPSTAQSALCYVLKPHRAVLYVKTHTFY